MSRLGSGGRYRTGVIAAAVALGMLAVGVGGSNARPAKSNATTISMLAITTQKPGFDVLNANFERVYPNIEIDTSYAATTPIRDQLEATQLAAGNAPDVLSVSPGCFKLVAVCPLAKVGHLAPMINKPWVRWSLPFVISLDKYGPNLYAFSPQVAPMGMFTNDDLFKKLGLRVPQTFAQLLDLCRKARTLGTVAIIFSADAQDGSNLIADLAVATLYGKDKRWPANLRAGKVSFAGTPGWRAALQAFADLNTSGCFQPGVTGTSAASAHTQFALGQGLIDASVSTNKGVIDAGSPHFAFSHHPFPGGTTAGQTATFINIQAGFGVNAHASTQSQAAAQIFLDFVARPKQNALFARINGGLTQYQFLHGQLPPFMSAYSSVLSKKAYVVNPQQTWWNPGVLLALQQNQLGLLTGQRSIDDVLNAMDAAWKKGPA
jgi:raffinose/stachyose/melibiose transport system substrate-binding protein